MTARRSPTHARTSRRRPSPRGTTLSDTLVSVWRQALVDGQAEVALGRRRYPVSYTRRKQLRTVSFAQGGREFFGIEQNPNTQSRWAALARAGKPVMQFSHGGRYIGNVSEGKAFRYPAWRALTLPE